MLCLAQQIVRTGACVLESKVQREVPTSDLDKTAKNTSDFSAVATLPNAHH